MNVGNLFKNKKALVTIIVILVVLALAVSLPLILKDRGEEPAVPQETPGSSQPTDPTDPGETDPTDPAVTMYTVTFLDYDGEILNTQQVESGKSAVAPEAPKREHFTFAGWDKSFENVTSDLVVTATYTTEKTVIYAESVSVNKGAGEVTVNIRIINNPGIMGAILKVSVDDRMFSFKSAGKTGYPGLTLTVPGSGVTGSPYSFMLDALELSNEDKQDGTLFSVTFKIKNADATGAFAVKLSYDAGAIFDEKYKDAKVVLENGTIRVK